MSRRKQFLVLSATVPLPMFGATVGVAAQKDFSICTFLKGTGAGYGLCRAGVAVGCADGTGNAQACANIEEHFLTVTGQSAPWLIEDNTCPCDFDQEVAKDSPPWADTAGSTVFCEPLGDMGAVIEDNQTPQTLIATGLLDNTSLSCRIESQGSVITEELTIDQNAKCLQELAEYWDALEPALIMQGINVQGELCND